MFQSTRPRGARHRRGTAVHADLCVSIHAPTRGATVHAARERLCVVVSIHAPTRGATYRRACAEIDDQVSIHAPTRGATCLHLRSTRPIYSFNPRAHAGRDSAEI